MSMKKLISLPETEQDSFLSSFDVVLADVDGVLFQNITNMIEGASNAVKNLRQLGKKVYFVTNNSMATIEWHVERFKDFETNKNEIIRPALALIWYLKNLNFNKEIYVVGFETLKSELEEAGFKVVSDKVEPVPETVEGLASIPNNIRPNVGAVVMDFYFNVNYTHIQRCIEYVKNNAMFLVGAGDEKGPMYNTFVMATMPFASIVKNFTGVAPKILAKPGNALINVLKENLGIFDPKRVIFIGDSVNVDLGFAAKSGYQKVLTLTGTTRPEELSDWKYDENLKPDYVLDSIKDLEVITNRKLQDLLH